MIATASWFARLPRGAAAVGISRGTPRARSGFHRLRELEPGPWFRTASPASYLELYGKLLNRHDARQVRNRLRTLGPMPVMLCFERADDVQAGRCYCHRHLVARPEESRLAFERKWELGTTARTVYALALYFGHRRSDVARVKWTDLEVAAGNVVQKKTGKSRWIPMQRELVAVLEATERRGEYVVLTQYGKPFSVKALGMRMQEWTRARRPCAGTHASRLAQGAW